MWGWVFETLWYTKPNSLNVKCYIHTAVEEIQIRFENMAMQIYLFVSMYYTVVCKVYYMSPA